MTALAVQLAILAALCYASYLVGVWRTKAYVVKIDQERQRAAMEAATHEPTDADLAGMLADGLREQRSRSN